MASHTNTVEREWMEMEEKQPASLGGKSPVAVAINTAAKAGEWIKSKLGAYERLHFKMSQHDLVTEVDKGAETMIRNLIHTYFPDHAILGEEETGSGSGLFEQALGKASSAEYIWIVDPLDGTTNFVHGFPFFSVSIAFACKGELMAGIVYDPMRDELFVAEKGKGAYVKGKSICVSQEKTLEHSLVATGLRVEQEQALPLGLRQINRMAPRVRNIRVAGSAALHLAYVAAGRLSGFWEPNLNVWDMAAGALLVREAGGSATDFGGRPYSLDSREIVASNGRIQGQLLHELGQA